MANIPKSAFPKIGLVVLALITLIVGLYGHYSSIWVKKVYYSTVGVIHQYEICKFANGSVSCPSISMERFFVAMVIICFLWSLVSLALDIVKQEKTQMIKYIDVGAHVVFGVLLLIACITFLVSTEQIKKLFVGNPSSLRRSAKLAGGIIGLFQSFLHGGVAFLSFRNP